MLRLLLIAALALPFASPALAYNFCSEPSPPSCARMFGAFYDESEFDLCRMQMQRYKTEVEDYSACLARAADEAIEEYNLAVKKFNLRASS